MGMGLEPAEVGVFEHVLTPAIMEVAWRYSCRLCRTREDAEDLLQEALAHALARFSQLRDLTRFKSWLMSIVRTQFLMQQRRNTAEKFTVYDREQDIGHSLADLASGPNADPLADITAASLSQLPAEQREILSLFYLDGLSLQEAGQVLGISTGAVRSRLYRARGALRRELKRLSLASHAELLR
jgi:RNA polymerase sigma-70 factor (ECF subfamily)